MTPHAGRGGSGTIGLPHHSDDYRPSTPCVACTHTAQSPLCVKPAASRVPGWTSSCPDGCMVKENSLSSGCLGRLAAPDVRLRFPLLLLLAACLLLATCDSRLATGLPPGTRGATLGGELFQSPHSIRNAKNECGHICALVWCATETVPVREGDWTAPLSSSRLSSVPEFHAFSFQGHKKLFNKLAQCGHYLARAVRDSGQRDQHASAPDEIVGLNSRPHAQMCGVIAPIPVVSAQYCTIRPCTVPLGRYFRSTGPVGRMLRSCRLFMWFGFASLV